MFLVPHLHLGADAPFRFAVSLRTGNPGKLLTDNVLITSCAESMVGRAFVFRTVIRIDAFDEIRARPNQAFGRQPGGTACVFVRQDGGIRIS